MHGIIRNFKGLKNDTFLMFYKAMVRSHMEYTYSALPNTNNKGIAARSDEGNQYSILTQK